MPLLDARLGVVKVAEDLVIKQQHIANLGVGAKDSLVGGDAGYTGGDVEAELEAALVQPGAELGHVEARVVVQDAAIVVDDVEGLPARVERADVIPGGPEGGRCHDAALRLDEHLVIVETLLSCKRGDDL